jgi:ubiquinone/menaquinone biosynthesis C-methylase UbiE
MDVMDMNEFKNGEFNVVVDKGTLDSLLCGDNSEPNAIKMLNEIHRVLTHNGVYICITYGAEESRLKYFVKYILIQKNLEWDIQVHKVAKPSSQLASTINADDKDPKNFHYVFTMSKEKK